MLLWWTLVLFLCAVEWQGTRISPKQPLGGVLLSVFGGALGFPFEALRVTDFLSSEICGTWSLSVHTWQDNGHSHAKFFREEATSLSRKAPPLPQAAALPHGVPQALSYPRSQEFFSETKEEYSVIKLSPYILDTNITAAIMVSLLPVTTFNSSLLSMVSPLSTNIRHLRSSVFYTYFFQRFQQNFGIWLLVYSSLLLCSMHDAMKKKTSKQISAFIR